MEVEPSVSISFSKKRKNYRTIIFWRGIQWFYTSYEETKSTFKFQCQWLGWCYTVADSDTELEVHIPVSQSDGAIPVKNDAHQSLDGNEALQLMRDAQTKHVAHISTAPPVQPRGGTIFLYNLELDKLKWVLMKRKVRYILGLWYCNMGYYSFIVVLNRYWRV